MQRIVHYPGSFPATGCTIPDRPPAPTGAAPGACTTRGARPYTALLYQELARNDAPGLAHERVLLRRQAALRFGADTAERLEEVLAGVVDPERLAETGEWLVRCETGDELLARVNPARTESGPSRH